LREWEARHISGNLKPNYPKTRKRRLSSEESGKYIDENPDAFLVEIGKYFDCCAEAVRKALKRYGLTLKKRPSAVRNGAKSKERNIRKK